MTAALGAMRIAAARDRVRARLVGRERELDLVLGAVAAGRDIVPEGPPGTSKSTLLRGITPNGASRLSWTVRASTRLEPVPGGDPIKGQL